MTSITFENYLRQQAEKSQYGVTVIQTQIALDIADWIEKNRQRTEVIKCEDCPFAPWDYWRWVPRRSDGRTEE